LARVCTLSLAVKANSVQTTPWYIHGGNAFFGEHWRFNGAEKKVSARSDNPERN